MTEKQPQTQQQIDDSLKADVRSANDDALMRVMLEFGIVLPNGGRNWRPTVRNMGHIQGFPSELRILCTDGIVAHFVLNDRSVFYGHIAQFSGEVKTLYSMPARDKVSTSAKPKKERDSVLKITTTMALDLLRKLTQKQ